MRPALLSVIDALKQLEAAKDALQQLTLSCDRKLKALKTALQPSFFHCGIQTLPDDVLGYIFKFVVHDSYDASAPVVLSHVSSRFRSLSLALPSLWSRLSSFMSRNHVQAYLRRSKDATLVVSMHGSTSVENRKQFLQLVTPHSSRWRSFRYLAVNPYVYYTSRTEIPLNLSALLAHVRVPNLECLDLRPSRAEHVHILQAWDMPGLHDVRLSGIVPSLTSRLFSSKVIRTVEFSWDAHQGPCDMGSLMKFLESLPNLVELRLDVSSRFDEERSGVVGYSIRLPRLTHYALKTSDAFVLFAMMNGLLIPRVVNMRLDVTGPFLDEVLARITSQTFMSVMNLELRYWHIDRPDDALDLLMLLRKFPAMERLDLCVPTCHPIIFHRTEIPPLRFLSLLLKSPPSPDFLRSFVLALKRGGQWPVFESFEFRCDDGRSLAEKREAMEILVGKKVCWLA